MMTRSSSAAVREDLHVLTVEKVENAGLCAACEMAPTCTFQRRPGERVIDCDEFEVSAAAAVAAPEPQAVGADPEARGLCAHCDRRETCTFPRPEGGVWRCEEYV